MKIKELKKLLVEMCFIIVSFALLLLTACNPVEEECEHTFSEEWSYDGECHWHAATCEHLDQVSDKNQHIWDEGQIISKATETEPGIKNCTCTICGYQKSFPYTIEQHEHSYSTQWSSDDSFHWHQMNCGCEKIDGTDNIKSDYEEHTFDTITHTCKCGKKEQYEITFADYNGKIFQTINKDYGSEIILTDEIDSPQRSNYIFKGWKFNDVVTECYIVNAPVTFYAYYKQSYNVTFVANYSIIDTQTVEEGSDAELPTSTPQHDGYIFKGWENYTHINQNKTINALFDPILYNVKYLMPDGQQIGETQAILYGSSATEPTKDQYWFNPETYHLFLFTEWIFNNKTDWTYSDIEREVVFQYANDPTVIPCVYINAVYDTEYKLPVVLIENGTAINDTTIMGNLSILLPSGDDCFIYGIDLKFSYADISINGDSLNTGSVYYDRTLTSDYNNKTKEFSLVWTSNSSGINYSDQQIIETITFNRPNKQVCINKEKFSLLDTSSLIIASTGDAEYEAMQKIVPIIIYK